MAQVSISGGTISGASVSTSPNVLQITTSALPAGQVQAAYSATIATTGGIGTLAFTVISGNLPTGLSLNPSTGAIAGTPTLATNNTFTVQVTDSTVPTPQTAQATLQIAINCPPLTIITSSTLPGGVNGQTYSVTMQASGGIAPLSWTLASGLFPSGLSISPTGIISGTPTENGTFSPVIQVQDSCSPPQQTVPATFSLTISQGSTPLTINTTSPLPGGIQNQPYSFQMVGSGGTGTGFTWTVSAGSLPTGLSMSSGGLITGTPSVLQTATFTVHLVDDGANSANLTNATLTISAQTAADNQYCQSNEVTTFNGQSDGPAVLPTKCVRTAMADTPTTGPTINVTVGSASDLQTKLTNAQCGQTIVIPAQTSPLPTQAQYVGMFTVPAVQCTANNWLVIRTDQIALLPEGVRITPCFIKATSVPNRPAYNCPSPTYAVPQLVANNYTAPVFTVTAGASHVRVIGIEFTNQPQWPISAQVNANGTDHVIFDRIIVHPGQSVVGNSASTCTIGGQAPGSGVNGNCTNSKGVSIDQGATYGALIDSYIYDMHADGLPNKINGGSVTGSVDAQGFITGNGPGTTGPFKVVNNFIEASGENIFTGGGSPSIGDPVTADLEIRRNHAFKPLSWKKDDPTYAGYSFQIKNCAELKNGNRALFEGNVFEGAWFGQSDQDGGCLLFTPKQANLTTPTVQDSNITIRYNVIRRANKGLEIAAGLATQCPAGQSCPSLPAFGFSVHDNLFDYINGPTAGTSNPAGGCCVYAVGIKLTSAITAFSNVSVVHNTFVQTLDASILGAMLQTAGGLSNSTGQFEEQGAWTLGNCYSQNDVAHNGGTMYISLASGICPTAGHVATAVDEPGVGASWQTYWQSDTATHVSWDGFTFKDNISMGGMKGIGLGGGIGACINTAGATATTLGSFTTVNGFPSTTGCYTATTNANGWCFAGNGLVTNPYPGSTFRPNTPFPTSSPNPACPSTPNLSINDWASVGFVNFHNGNGGDYHLLSTSPGHLAASDGKDIGADIDALNQKIAGVADQSVNQSVIVTLAPASATVPIPIWSATSNPTRAFTATVTGTSNTNVTWQLCANGTCYAAGVASQYGVISTAGVYTAPSIYPNPPAVTIQATSQADPSKSATAAITVDRGITWQATNSVGTAPGTPGSGACPWASMLASKGTDFDCHYIMSTDPPGTFRDVRFRVGVGYVAGNGGVIHFHGSGNTYTPGICAVATQGGNWMQAADRHHIIVACPHGIAGNVQGWWNWWNPVTSAWTQTQDETGFIWAILQDMVTQLGADPNNLHTVGISGGANIQTRLAIEDGALLGSIGWVDGSDRNFDEQDTLCGAPCQGIGRLLPSLNYPVSVLVIRGTVDNDILPYCSTNAHSATLQEDFDYFTTQLGTGAPVPNGNNYCPNWRGGAEGTETYKTATGGRGNSEVRTYVLTHAAHQWYASTDISTSTASAVHNSQLRIDFPQATPNAACSSGFCTGFEQDIYWDFFNNHKRGAHTVTIAWTASTTSGVTYNVYRSTTSGGPYTLLSTGIFGTTLTDAAVSGSTTYYYVIRAFDGTLESVNSNEATAVIP